MISVVIETWNARDRLAELLDQIGPAGEIVVTYSGERPQLAGDIRWVELPDEAGYYDHKNAGFAAARGEIVAFVDGDCGPQPGWLAALTDPIARGEARVVAGATSYPGALAPLANQLDFPYFRSGRDWVRNFFANNVAFARETFSGYPRIAPMFHGQCQVLGLTLRAAGVPIRFAPAARVFHAWPDGPAEWLAVRLLRGADAASLLPYVVAHYAPRAAPIVARFGRAPALGVLALRALVGTWTALWHGPVVRGLALVAGVTVVDAIGAAAAPVVYRAYDQQ